MKFKKTAITGIALIFFFSINPINSSTGQKVIFLNFDDGPRPAVLEKLLPVLQKYNVPGTFFVEGAIAANSRNVVKKLRNAGHEVENHSWGHENFKKLFAEKGGNAVKKSLLKTETAIFSATGVKPRFFRPPYWAINDEIEKIIRAEGYTVMKLDNPDINTEDYNDAAKHHPPKILIERVKRQVAAQERRGKFRHVLVFHELNITAEALKTLIPYFQDQGYRFKRLDEVMQELDNGCFTS